MPDAFDAVDPDVLARLCDETTADTAPEVLCERIISDPVAGPHSEHYARLLRHHQDVLRASRPRRVGLSLGRSITRTLMIAATLILVPTLPSPHWVSSARTAEPGQLPEFDFDDVAWLRMVAKKGLTLDTSMMEAYFAACERHQVIEAIPLAWQSVSKYRKQMRFDRLGEVMRADGFLRGFTEQQIGDAIRAAPHIRIDDFPLLSPALPDYLGR